MLLILISRLFKFWVCNSLNAILYCFIYFFSAIQKNFVDMENMFDLLTVRPEIVDAPGAPSLVIREGAVEFRNVNFSYNPDREILKNVSFYVPPGKTLALVSFTFIIKLSVKLLRNLRLNFHLAY